MPPPSWATRHLAALPFLARIRPVVATTPTPAPASTPAKRPARRPFTTLGIETSCDDTCVAILTTDPSTRAARLPFNAKLTSDNRQFRGVFPPAALDGHASSLAGLVSEALRTTSSTTASARPDLVAVTRGPGMSANLAEGLALAKGLSVAWDVPLLAVNHMQAHALTPRLVDALDAASSSHPPTSNRPPDARDPAPTAQPGPPAPAFPFLTLLVSGGHTQLVHSRSLTDHRILANSANIALGDALDKCARLILPDDLVAACPDVMYARALEAFAFPPATADRDLAAYVAPARRADEIEPYTSPHGWTLHPPLASSRRLAYEFSALQSHVQSVLALRPNLPLPLRRALAYDVMRIAFEHLAGRVLLALAADPSLASHASALVVSGGVASNRFLATVLRSMLDARGFPHLPLVAPPLHLCTDNAAMIAWTGWEMYRAGYSSSLDVRVLKKWSVDPTAPDGGILGPEGWLHNPLDS